MPKDDVTIRPFAGTDRDAVRSIACETADRGSPVENFFPDRELIADLLTRYYTDFESQATWVAAVETGVVGYVTGCLWKRRYGVMMALRVCPCAVIAAWRRGTWADPGVRRFILANVKARLTCRSSSIALIRYPAHLHINFLSEYRGRGIGQRLLTPFLNQVSDAGLPGVHASVREDNPGACRFFEKMGFVSLGRRFFLQVDPEVKTMVYSVVYGRRSR